MKISDLHQKQNELSEKLSIEEIQAKKTKEELSRVSSQISKLKETQDYGSFKFVHDNVPLIMTKIAPKHKIPEPREIEMSNGETPMTVSVPWDEGKCSDENPININVCPRCTLLHFKEVMGRLLAGYYAK